MPFTDVPENLPYRQAVLWAFGEGIIVLSRDEILYPDIKISREVFVTMLGRYSSADKIYVEISSEYLGIFDDCAAISAWAAPSVCWAADTGLVTGSIDSGSLCFDPQSGVTRAQAAAKFYMLIQTV